MANVCTFVIRIKGEREKVGKFPIKDLPCNEVNGYKERKTKSGKVLSEIHGECAWSIDGTLLNGNSRVLPMIALSKKYDLEIEIFGYNMEKIIAGDLAAEHCIYKNGDVLKEHKSASVVKEEDWDDYSFGRANIENTYDFDSENKEYKLKAEYKTMIEYDEVKEKVILPWEKLIY